MAQRCLVYFDSFTRLVLPLCSAMHREPVTNCVFIVDASSLGVKQAWDVREFARDVSWILTTCFPETIHRVYVSSLDPATQSHNIDHRRRATSPDTSRTSGQS